MITGEVSDQGFGILPIARFELPLARHKVRYCGEPVAAVAAETPEIAAQALGLIELELRELPAYDSADALVEGAAEINAERKGNLDRLAEHELGDVDAAFAAADLVREASFHCGEVNHAQIETHAALADYDPDRGHLTVHCTTQVPYYVHLMLAKVLDLEMAHIRVVKPFIGGGFGSRAEALNVEIIEGFEIVHGVILGAKGWGTRIYRPNPIRAIRRRRFAAHASRDRDAGTIAARRAG